MTLKDRFHLSIICIIVAVSSFPSESFSLNGADVAVYNDTSYPEGGAWREGIDAIKAMLDSYGYNHEDITPDQINNTGNLHSLYKVIIIGGGWAGGYNAYINRSGYENIRQFVSSGGGYFGICAGSYFASEVVMWKPNFSTPFEVYHYPLGIFHGVARGAVLSVKAWTSPTGCVSGITEGGAMTTVRIDSSLVPGVRSDVRMLYYGGPVFIPFPDQTGEISVVGRYEVPRTPADGTPAMILFQYGGGRVFLSSPHPEISFDECTLYYDPETWELMNSILSLLME